MVDVIFELFVAVIDLEGKDFNGEIKLIKKFGFKSINLTKEDLQELINKLMYKKTDWFTYNYDYSIADYYASFTLIFHNKVLTSEQESLISEIIKDCEKFFDERKTPPSVDSHEGDEVFAEDGFILSVSNPESEIIFSYHDIEEILKANGIDYRILNITRSCFEGGCGLATESFIFSIASAIQSGITLPVRHISSSSRAHSVAIANGRILEGKLNKRQKDLIKAWMLIHREEIWDRWNKAIAGEYIERIEPKEI